MIIAPATANTMSKMSDGEVDNLVVATYLSAKCPVFVAPALDLDLYKHPSTKINLDKFVSFCNIIIPEENGELPSGLSAEGGMSEQENIVRSIETQLLQAA